MEVQRSVQGKTAPGVHAPQGCSRRGWCAKVQGPEAWVQACFRSQSSAFQVHEHWTLLQCALAQHSGRIPGQDLEVTMNMTINYARKWRHTRRRSHTLILNRRKRARDRTAASNWTDRRNGPFCMAFRAIETRRIRTNAPAWTTVIPFSICWDRGWGKTVRPRGALSRYSGRARWGASIGRTTSSWKMEPGFSSSIDHRLAPARLRVDMEGLDVCKECEFRFGGGWAVQWEKEPHLYGLQIAPMVPTKQHPPWSQGIQLKDPAGSRKHVVPCYCWVVDGIDQWRMVGMEREKPGRRTQGWVKGPDTKSPDTVAGSHHAGK